MTPRLIAEQERALSTYLDELERWNRRINLTAVPRGAAWTRHVSESLELLEVAAPPFSSTAVDVGSGNGALGVVLGVARPDIEVVLIESDSRKAAFLEHLAGLLGLSNVAVAPMRAEVAGTLEGMRQHFDLAMARAVAPSPVLCELALPLVRVGGRMCAIVTAAGAAARECAAASRLCGGGIPQRQTAGVLRIDKERDTPDIYPRRPGVPARRPLL